MTLTSTSAARAEFHWLFCRSRTPVLRSMFDFASEEFVIPKGLHKGTLVDWDVQPFARLLVCEFDNPLWRRSAIVGCVQSGKSTFAWVLPAMYYACECRDAIVISAPTTKILHKKWRKEVLPAFNASRYRNLLPRDGLGSRGGTVEEIALANGGTITFMSGGGGDENRSSDTVRCALLTEADKMDTAGETSREAPPTVQIEARTKSYPQELRRFHAECTVSVKKGFIWMEYQKGTASRIVCPCPHCGDWVTPEREHLVGWQEGDTEAAAEQLAYFACPSCGDRITDQQRVAMNRQNRLVHRGQSIDSEGVVHGDPPDTDTLGFRWNAFNNLFWTPGEIGAKEWVCFHATSDQQALEKELCQFYWAVPYESPEFDATPLDAQQIRQRFSVRRYTKGLVPSDWKKLALAIDCGKRFCTWTNVASRPVARRHVVNYGTFEVRSRDMDEKVALLDALKNFRDDVVLHGWHTPEGETLIPNVVFVDAGWHGDVVYAFCRESGPRFRPAIGYGLSQNRRRYRNYHRPTKTGAEVKMIGEEFYVVYLPDERLFRVDFNTDYWKTRLFEALRLPPDKDGAMEFYYSDDPNEHVTVAKHYVSERQEEVFTPGVGTEIRWRIEHRQNHYLDNGSNVFCALRLVSPSGEPLKTEPSSPAAAEPRAFLTPDGRPYLLTDRE